MRAVRVGLVTSLLLASPLTAFALTSGQSACRDTVVRTVTRYSATVQKLINGCHQRRSAGDRPMTVDCNEPDDADISNQLSDMREDARADILSACTGQESLLGEYQSCPSPAAFADNGGATTGIDNFGELADCVTVLSELRLRTLMQDASGLPPERLLDPIRKCQGKLGKGVARLVKTYLGERRRCQREHDATATAASYDCGSSDPRGRIEKARLKFEDRMETACAFSPSVIEKLGACAGTFQELIACSLASADTRGAALARDSYELLDDGSGSSTTTTTNPTGTGCGATFPTCDGDCEIGSTCQDVGSSCSCVADGTGPCEPATIIRTIRAKYGSIPSPTSLSTGWSGFTHDVDIPDLTGDVVDVTCDANCENCDIDMNVQQGDPASNCRCTANSQTTCNVINGSDPASCGSIDPTCRCYFGAPLPLSSGGTPACVVNRIREDYNGTMNLRTGEWSDQIRLASVVYLGLDQVQPCPTCDGDPIPNDGVRGGSCAGGVSTNQCDANGVHATYGATSFDCLPASAANVSGSGLLINLNSSSDPISMAATLPCDTPAGGRCPCRTCTGNGNLGCSSDSDCSAAGAGVCTVGGGAGVVLNQCTNFQCAASGQCQTGPVDKYCDQTVHPDGRGFIRCTNNNDCTSTSSGTCTLNDIRRCFPDPITASGVADPFTPVSAALFCIAPTSNPAINLAAGLPGPGKFVLRFDADIRCKSNPNLVYEFPAGANCEGGGGTTTTTLLPLPECGDAEAPVCGGVCPLGQTCGANGSVCECTGVPLPACEDAVSPVCGGVCSGTDELCLDNAGTCECQIPTLPQCSSATAPVCGGLCPTGEICTDVGGSCECGAPGVPSCASAASPVCGGLCDTGSICMDMGGLCGCFATPLPTCAQATAPLCAGTCSIGSLCQANGDACQCTTIPLP